MATFTPPVVYEGSSDYFWGRYTIPVGQSVVEVDGTFRVMPYPWLGTISPLTEGVEYFLGGRTYDITDAVALALVADGFTVIGAPGDPGGGTFAYGDGPYGEGPYGG